MKRKNLFWQAGTASLLAVLLLLFTVFVTGCPVEPSGPEGQAWTTPGLGVIRGVPIITEHPTSFDYTGSEITNPLRVVAQRVGLPHLGELGNLTDDPNFEIYWYSVNSFTNTGGTRVGSGATFMPPGSGYFYAVITNPNGGWYRRSNPARVRTNHTRAVPDAVINITTTERQYIRAFGGMSNGFPISGDVGEIPRYMENDDIDTMFNPENPNYLGFKILRKHLFPATLSDILTGRYNNFPSMLATNALFVHHIRMVNTHGGYVVLAPWTPSYFHWKEGNHPYGSIGRYLLTRYHREYVQYLKNFIQDLDRYNAPIFAVSLQNEPTYPAGYYGMLIGDTQQRDIMRDWGHIITGLNPDGTQGPNWTRGTGGGITGANLPDGRQRVRFMGGSPHNNVLWNDPALNDPIARRHLEIVAYHTYGSWSQRHGLSLDQEPRRETWMMEKNINSGSGQFHRDSQWELVWLMMNEIHHIIAHNDSSVYCWWYTKRFYSFIGDATWGTTNGEVLPRGHTIAHYALYLTDTVRLETTSSGFGDAPVINLWNQAQDHINPGQGVRVVAGARRANPPNNYTWNKLKTHEDRVTMVVFDSRQPPENSTTWPAGNAIRINLPEGFTATSAHGIISGPQEGNRTSINFRAPAEVVLNADGRSADIFLASDNIISLAFNGTWE